MGLSKTSKPKIIIQTHVYVCNRLDVQKGALVPMNLINGKNQFLIVQQMLEDTPRQEHVCGLVPCQNEWQMASVTVQCDDDDQQTTDRLHLHGTDMLRCILAFAAMRLQASQ